MENENDSVSSSEIINKSVENNFPKINFLNELFSHVTELPTIIRDRICHECNWSIPTFYRKAQTIKDKDNRAIKSLSNAEKSTVLEVFHDAYTNLTAHLSNCERDKNKFI